MSGLLLPEELPIGQIWDLDTAVEARRIWQTAGTPVVFTNGHFDLIHAGHVDYLEKARAIGGEQAILIVGINGDQSTRRLKGPGRPLIPAVERALLIAALRCVTTAIIFEAETAVDLIKALRPDWYVKGGDYDHKFWPERALAVHLGGQVALIPYLPDHSTSALIARIRALPASDSVVETDL